MKNKKGNTTVAITLLISLAFLLVLTIYIVNMITPFIWYQKLENISSKYIYVIERFGYLTQEEEDKLYEELKNDGFNVRNVVVDCPKQPLEYGTLFKFEIKYNMRQNYNIINNGIKNEARYISLRLKKYSYSKI